MGHTNTHRPVSGGAFLGSSPCSPGKPQSPMRSSDSRAGSTRAREHCSAAAGHTNRTWEPTRKLWRAKAGTTWVGHKRKPCWSRTPHAGMLGHSGRPPGVADPPLSVAVCSDFLPEEPVQCGRGKRLHGRPAGSTQPSRLDRACRAGPALNSSARRGRLPNTTPAEVPRKAPREPVKILTTEEREEGTTTQIRWGGGPGDPAKQKCSGRWPRAQGGPGAAQ